MGGLLLLKFAICVSLYLSLQCNHLLDAWQAVLVDKFLQSLEVVNLVFLITMVSDLFSKKAVIDLRSSVKNLKEESVS